MQTEPAVPKKVMLKTENKNTVFLECRLNCKNYITYMYNKDMSCNFFCLIHCVESQNFSSMNAAGKILRDLL